MIGGAGERGGVSKELEVAEIEVVEGEIVEDGEPAEVEVPWTQKLFNDALGRNVAETLEKTGVPLEDWIITGRKSKEWPTKESLDWWSTKGPEMLETYVAWRRATQWPIWIAPDGRKGIELEFNVPWIPGGKNLRGFIDRIFVHPLTRQLVVVDIKSGSRFPEDRQLGEYASAIEIEFGVRPKYGMYLMVRKDPKYQDLIPLDKPRHSKEYLIEQSIQIQKGIDNEIFFTKPSNLCGTCSVREHCPEFAEE